MSIEVRLRRGTSTEHNSFTGNTGEVTMDTTLNTLRVHDGSTVGGHLLLSNNVGTTLTTRKVEPAANNTHDLGSTSKRYANLFANNATITTLILGSVLGTSVGGTGLSSFTQNGVFYASNTSAMAQATGTNGQVMQIAASGVPNFDDVDGGTF